MIHCAFAAIFSLAVFAAWSWYKSRIFLVELFVERRTEDTFQVSRDFDASQVETVQNSRPILANAYQVIQYALREPEIASLSVVAKQSDPMRWIHDSMEVDTVRIKEKDKRRAMIRAYDHASVLRFRARRADAEELRLVLDRWPAVWNRYYDEVVVYPGTQRRLIIRDALMHSIQQIDNDVRQLERRDVIGINEDSRIAGAGVQDEVERLRLIRESMSVRLKQFEAEGDRDGNLYPIRPAEIRAE